LVFRKYLTEATRMTGGSRTRGMRPIFRVWCLYSQLVFGFQEIPDRGHKDGGWGEDKRDEADI
jgi:hypothetical protein